MPNINISLNDEEFKILEKVEKIALEDGEKGNKIEKEINKVLEIEERIKSLLYLPMPIAYNVPSIKEVFAKQKFG